MIKALNKTANMLFILIIIIFGCSTSGSKSDQSDINKLPFEFPDLKPPVFRDQIFNILDYGARPEDSLFMNTEAIRAAIHACNQAGGGRVLIPQGIWTTGPVHLMSNVNLHLEEGAELRFSQNFDDYLPVILIQRGGFFCYNYSPPVYARDCENIAITGSGVLNGKGQVWWPWKKTPAGYG